MENNVKYCLPRADFEAKSLGSISHIVRKDSVLEERLREKFRLGESVMGSAGAVREASAGAKTLIIFQPSVSRADMCVCSGF